MSKEHISLKKVCVHNLKSVDLEMDAGELVVFTGVSGSGKSSMAFDTLYVEGQRRYIESLSTHARRYLGDLAKPELESVSGLSPTIAIEQKSAGKNPRSTVGTLTEIYDYIRVLYARVGVAHCPISHEAVKPQSKERIIKTIQGLEKGSKVLFLAPFVKEKKGEFKEDFELFLRKGFMRARVDGSVIDLSDGVTLDKNLTHTIDIVIDRLVIEPTNHSRIAEAVMLALEVGNGVMSLHNLSRDEEILFSMHAFSKKSGLSYRSLEPNDFSFNSPSGMCPTCNGLGRTQEFDLWQVIDPHKSIAQDCCAIASSYQTVRYGNIYNNLADLYGFSVHTPWGELSEKGKKVFLYGTEKKWTLMHFTHPTRPTSWSDYVQWRGVLFEAKKRYTEAKSDRYKKKVEKQLSDQICSACQGTRLKPYPAATLLGNKKVHEITALTISELLKFFKDLKLNETEKVIANELVKEIEQRLWFLIDVGLHYICLDRTAPTLSGGEAQRVRLASQVGCGLVGVTYILDEPSIGLHPRDNKKLLGTLQHLRDLGNTVVVVEHDEETIRAADRVIDFGPGPGNLGGNIVCNGSLEALVGTPQSVTGAYISGTKKIEIPQTRRAPTKEKITLHGASHNNLKNIDFSIPLGIFVALTGVSGSGKSSLVTDTLHPALSNLLHHGEHRVGKYKKISGLKHIDKVIAIDQAPIGRTPRSNPATYIKLLDEIRTIFATMPDSKARGYGPGRFSFNVAIGSCTQCHGMGMTKVDMDFMEDQWVRCAGCLSKRFDKETLSILYKGKSIYDVLEMTIDEAATFFQNIPTLKRKLQMVKAVGMGYITLGQSSTTLSGGEAQRIKLAKELVRSPSGKTLYILDEPTTGLHFQDIERLLEVLHTLVDRGNTVLVIEHNMDVVKTADWVIDLGPEGGRGGGKIVGFGTPEKIAKLKTPTALAIHEALFPEDKTRESVSFKDKPKQRLKQITIKGAEQNNLKSLDLSIPRGKFSVCSGPSGSGKSSLAFDTVYAEGQRRYIESLSPYARQFVKQSAKPKLSSIEGLLAPIAIEQKSNAGNPRSTVGTQTEIFDYLRILFAQAGTPFCPETGEEIKSITKESVVHHIMQLLEGEKIVVLAPLTLDKGDSFEELVATLQRQGYLRIRLNEQIYELDEPIAFDRKRKNTLALVVDRLKVTKKNESRLFEAVEGALHVSKEKVLVQTEEKEHFFNLAFAVEKTGKSYPKITPQSFSFNSPEGMCPDCQGLGVQWGANLRENPDILSLSLKGLLNFFWTTPASPLKAFFKKKGIDIHAPLHALEAKHLNLIFSGSDEIIQDKGFSFSFLGIEPVLASTARTAKKLFRSPLLPLLDEISCTSCLGSRINPLARNVRLNGHSIASLCSISIEKTLDFISSLSLNKKKQKLLQEVVIQLKGRLTFLHEVGLSYLSLDRKAPTLSNGEAQRIRLARQLGSSLTGILYVLDEPTIGLHPHDTEKLLASLTKLQKLGNTLLVVEHDRETLSRADHILDFGPGAGSKGGHLVANGTFEDILRDPASLTGAFLSGKETIALPKKRRKAKEHFDIKDACENNLKNLTIQVPVGVLTCLTGLSGTGKSTLLHDIIKKEVKQKHLSLRGPTLFNRLIVIDQNPTGHTVRSDVGTYVEALSVLREFYASLASARAKGLKPGHFSTNHRKGMCTHCFGLGYKKVEMLFLPPVKVVCEECHGLRLNPLSLSIKYEHRSFGQLFDLTIAEAAEIFQFLPKARRIFETLTRCGLDYLTLGQEMVSLSGGEAQRMKLSRELSKRSSGKTLYLLDEPTTGLHPVDIRRLLSMIHQLVDKGNTVILIEHNLDVIKNADYLFDLGQEPGEKGGELVAQGTPEEVCRSSYSLTGRYLSPFLHP